MMISRLPRHHGKTNGPCLDALTIDEAAPADHRVAPAGVETDGYQSSMLTTWLLLEA